MYVYVNGYGLRPFRATEKAEYNEGIPPQLRGQYKLPKGIRRMDESKWIDLDYLDCQYKTLKPRKGLASTRAEQK